MDLDDPTTFRLFLEIFGTLPRAGPGSKEDTLRTLAMVPRDPLAAAIANETEKEIEMFRRDHECHSYGFFVVKPTDERNPTQFLKISRSDECSQ